jgi:hypothetical protein
MKNFNALLTTTYLAIALVSPAIAQTNEQALAAAKAASEKYMDVNVALAAGFIPDPSGVCATAAEAGLPPEMGAMGVHYLNMAKLKITGNNPIDGQSTHTDFNDPAILIYEPQSDGSMQLVGVENLVFQAAWSAAGNSEPPVFAGAVWDTMANDPATAGDEAHGFAPHFDRHAWLFRDNPAGVFVPFNPAVTCANG